MLRWGGGQWKSPMDMPHWDMSVDVMPAGAYDCWPCFSSALYPPSQYITWLVFHHQCQKGWRELVWVGQRGVGLPTDTFPHSLPKPSPNMYGRDVASALMCVGNTVSLFIMPLIYMVSPVKSPRKPQYPPPQPLIFGVYPPPTNFSLPFSGCVTHSSCGLINDGDLLSRKPA